MACSTGGKPRIKAITVKSAILVQPQSQNRGINTTANPEEWYKGSYTIFIQDESSGAGRMRVWTDRAVWKAENPALAMMTKVQLVINANAFEHCLDLESVTAQAFMQFAWPWELLWHSFENS